jgi:hypothetical protein
MPDELRKRSIVYALAGISSPTEITDDAVSVEDGADFSVRVKLAGHDERPDEIVECTRLFVNERPSGKGSTRLRSCENEAPSSESITPEKVAKGLAIGSAPR